MKKLGTGEAWAVFAALNYAAQGLTLRAAAVDVPPLLGAIMMAVPTFLTMGLVVGSSRQRRNQLNPRSESFMGYGTVGLIAAGAIVSYALGNTLWVLSMARGGITVAAPATQSTAIWSALLGLVVLKERVTPGIASGIVIFTLGLSALGIGRAAMAGMEQQWGLGLVAGLSAAFCWSVTNVITRSVLLRGVDRFVALGTSISFGLVALNVSLLVTSGVAPYIATPPRAYMFLVLAGLFNIGAQVSLVSALGLTAVASVSMITAAGGIIAPVAGALIFSDPMNWIMTGGILLVVAGTVTVQLAFARRGAPLSLTPDET